MTARKMTQESELSARDVVFDDDLRVVSEQPATQSTSRNMSSSSPKSDITIHLSRRAVRNLIIVLIVIAALLIVARAMHWHNWGLSQQQIQERQVAALVAQVGHVMILPQGETPVVAAVTDASQLKQSQQFYQDAQNGDVLLVYTKAQRAILFRPGTNQIVNVGPIYLNPKTQSAQSQTATSSQTDTATSSTR